MTITLQDYEVREIASILKLRPQDSEVLLSKKEIQQLYDLSNQSNCTPIKVKFSNTGIGSIVRVEIDGLETDITDYDSW